jgi:flagellar basal-body rod modification protein FlgD
MAIEAATNTGSTDMLDKNTFLKLFTTQLKYQDPLNPMDTTAFTAQLAQFSTLEQMYNANNQLASLLETQNTMVQGLSVGLIGKTVTLQDGTSAKVAGILFDEGVTNIVLDNSKKVLLTDIKQISA